MGRRSRQKGRRIDGVLLLDKPSGMTSNQALQKVKRLLDARKAGHTGALDPAATGMLPLCFGEATKVSGHLLDADKTYRVTAALGVAKDTGDGDGDTIESRNVPELDKAGWQDILDGFLGESEQIPPMYSALKVDGKRLYELARRGQTVVRKPRRIRIRSIELLEAAGERLVFRVHCSKGTYIRSLVEDIARKAGTVAYTARLYRETVAGFDEADMLDMDTVEQLAAAGELEGRLMPADTALAGYPSVALDSAATARFLQGQAVTPETAGESGLVRVYAADGVFLGIGEREGPLTLAPRKVFLAPEEKL